MNHHRYFLAICALLMLLRCEQGEPPVEVDMLIKGATVYDGSGSEPASEDVGIKGDQIVFLGNSDQEDVLAEQEIDANGYVLSPGFIDLHAHGNPIETPEFENFISMGVTTIALGQDGSSPLDLGVWLDQMDTINIGPNIAMFIGHGSLRRMVGIGTDPEPSFEKIEEMKNVLNQHLPGLFGMSTGLEYVPGLYANETELLALAETVGQNQKLIMSHMRNEDDDQLINSINELIRQGEFSRVHISHLKSVYGKGRERAEEILKVLEEANSHGIQITADVYPYNASYTGISILFPEWAKTRADFDAAMPARRQELETFLENKVNLRNGPEATLIGSGPFKGRNLSQVADDLDKSFVEVLIDDIGPQGASGAYFVMNAELQNRLIQSPLVGISSDGSPTMHHPRGYGSFAKVIDTFVVKDSLLTLQEAIYKMTSFPASILQLQDRGSIEIGKKADLILFKPENIKALATYEDPHQVAKGFDYVMVNGEFVKSKEGLPTLSGKLLKP